MHPTCDSSKPTVVGPLGSILAGRVRRPDSTVARRELGWEPVVSLRDGLERTIPYFRALVERGANARSLFGDDVNVTDR